MGPAPRRRGHEFGAATSIWRQRWSGVIRSDRADVGEISGYRDGIGSEGERDRPLLRVRFERPQPVQGFGNGVVKPVFGVMRNHVGVKQSQRAR